MADFAAAVLTGGASSRMGRDKAAIEIDGTAMAERVVAQLRAAGASEVVRVGDQLPDVHPGAGPLGGVLAALGWSTASITVVAPCDLLAPDATAFRALVDGLAASTADAAVPARDRPLPLALRHTAAAPLAEAFAAGERALRIALTNLAVVEVDLPAVALADADVPDELPPGAR